MSLWWLLLIPYLLYGFVKALVARELMDLEIVPSSVVLLLLIALLWPLVDAALLAVLLWGRWHGKY